MHAAHAVPGHTCVPGEPLTRPLRSVQLPELASSSGGTSRSASAALPDLPPDARQQQLQRQASQQEALLRQHSLSQRSVASLLEGEGLEGPQVQQQQGGRQGSPSQER